MGGNLCDGDIDNEEVICPLHMWRFNIKTGENTMPGMGNLNSYKVEVDGTDLVIEA
jgi:nitrite reductase/ring-hydroxylating ferredoxin subunit